MRIPFLILPMALLVAACADPEEFVSAPKVVVTESIRTPYPTIEIAEVSLPAYAASAEIVATDEERLVATSFLWADDPTRQVTLALTRNIKELTGRKVASQPWPFEENALARVDVRVEEFIVSGSDLLFSGQYFVAAREEFGRDHAHLFEFTYPLTTASESELAAGRSALIADLARDIARRGLR